MRGASRRACRMPPSGGFRKRREPAPLFPRRSNLCDCRGLEPAAGAIRDFLNPAAAAPTHVYMAAPPAPPVVSVRCDQGMEKV